MVYFQTKNPNLGKFWTTLDWKMLIYFMAVLEYSTDIWDILRQFGTFCVHLVHFSGFGIMHQVKSGNPGLRSRKNLKLRKESRVSQFLFLGLQKIVSNSKCFS
jgi:hypothetical protein